MEDAWMKLYLGSVVCGAGFACGATIFWCLVASVRHGLARWDSWRETRKEERRPW